MGTYESKFIYADGLLTHYLEAGHHNARPVVLIHGGGAGADAVGNWKTVIPVLAREFRVIAYDMPGFGRTEKPDPAGYDYSQPARNRHLADFLRALGIAPAALVGNSMGGATALGVAMEQPALVDRLVLMGSAGLNAAITDALKPILFYDFTMDGMRRLVDALTGSAFAASEDLLAYRHALSVEPDVKAAYGAIMGWIKAQGGLFYPEDAIARVRTPCLVVNGKDDIVVPVANAYRFLELLENSWGYVIPHCGHWAMLEAPDAFAGMTRSFLLQPV